MHVYSSTYPDPKLPSSAISDSHRYGFQGMEADDEVKGEGNSYTTEFRQFDARLGRWLSIDPLQKMFPEMAPYVSMNNNPIVMIDPSGLKSERKGKEGVNVLVVSKKEVDKSDDATLKQMEDAKQNGLVVITAVDLADVNKQLKALDKRVNNIYFAAHHGYGGIQHVYFGDQGVGQTYNTETKSYDFVTKTLPDDPNLDKEIEKLGSLVGGSVIFIQCNSAEGSSSAKYTASTSFLTDLANKMGKTLYAPQYNVAGTQFSGGGKDDLFDGGEPTTSLPTMQKDHPYSLYPLDYTHQGMWSKATPKIGVTTEDSLTFEKGEVTTSTPSEDTKVVRNYKP